MNLVFANRFVHELPGDPDLTNERRQVSGACYSFVAPTPVSSPQLLGFSPEAAALLDLTEEDCRSEAFLQVFSGNTVLPGMQPFAMRYGGHQFGSWAGQLGDGRAINLGEVINRQGQRWTLQLKGAGPTPYSRSADGLAVLRSSLREFLCSEAMYHLGIPTTRALSLIATGEQVLRDMFYDGHPRLEPGAIVCRLAPSFVRFGNFEIHTAHDETNLLHKLLDHTLAAGFPELSEKQERDRYLHWFGDVCRRTAELMVHWMRVGFVHGVMNTDNMSVLGLTIDYGPYGWLEAYDPLWTPNTTDAQGRRYCYGNQPRIALWNLVQLANAIYPLIGSAEALQETLGEYQRTFQTTWQHTLAAKFGLPGAKEEDFRLMERMLDLMRLHEIDMTIFFRRLADVTGDDDDNQRFCSLFAEALYRTIPASEQTELDDWLGAYRRRLNSCRLDPLQRRRQMNRINPKYVFRNYLAQLAIDQVEQGDTALLTELLDVLRHPYDDQPDSSHLAARRPEWARNRAGCSMLSCSS